MVDQLILSCRALSSPTLCRFIPALSQRPPLPDKAQPKALFYKFVEHVEEIFKNLPKPLEWQSFYIHDLPLLMDFCEEVREVSIQPQLSEKCSIGRSLLYVIRYLTRYHLDFDNSIPARLALRSIAGRWRAGMVK